MIISRDAEATDKIQHILVIKILNKIEGKHLNITTKAIYDKPRDNVTLSDEKLGFPQVSGTRQGHSLSPHLFNASFNDVSIIMMDNIYGGDPNSLNHINYVCCRLYSLDLYIYIL